MEKSIMIITLDQLNQLINAKNFVSLIKTNKLLCKGTNYSVKYTFTYGDLHLLVTPTEDEPGGLDIGICPRCNEAMPIDMLNTYKNFCEYCYNQIEEPE